MSDTPAAPAPAATPVVEGGTVPTDAPEGAVAKPKLPTYRQIKIGDETISMTDADIARDYGKWRGADAKFREADTAKKQIEAFQQAFANDPDKVLSDPRISKETRAKLAEKWLVAQIEEELGGAVVADPRDEKLSAAERKLKEFTDREEKAASDKEEEATQQRVQERVSSIRDTLKAAGERSPLAGDPASEAALLREMATYMRAAAEQGESVTADQLVEHVHNQRFQQFYALANQFDGPELIDFLGEAVVKKIRQADLAKLRAGRGEGVSQRTQPGRSQPAGDKRAPPVDAYEMIRRANKQLLGK